MNLLTEGNVTLQSVTVTNGQVDVQGFGDVVAVNVKTLGGDGSMLEGVLAGIEEGYFQAEIAESAFREQERLEAGDLVRVGVNAFVEEGEEPLDTLVIGPEAERDGGQHQDGARARQRRRVEFEIAMQPARGACRSDGRIDVRRPCKRNLADLRTRRRVAKVEGLAAQGGARRAVDQQVRREVRSSLRHRFRVGDRPSGCGNRRARMAA